MEVAGVLSNVTLRLIDLIIEGCQAKDQVRRSFDIVRTCDRDLQFLITLRDAHLDILERKPAELARVNAIIEDTHNGLLEVGRIVERCRPEANKGRLPLYRRGIWALFNFKEFNSQVPVINGHHQTVLAEIIHLRQIALHVPPPMQIQVVDKVHPLDEDTKAFQEKRIDIDNVDLLSSLMGGISITRSFAPTSQVYEVDSAYDLSDSQETPPPPPPLPPKPPSYRDPNFIAMSSAQHISLADIEASRGGSIYEFHLSAVNIPPPDIHEAIPETTQVQPSAAP